jgi:hypothetical protein
MTLELLVGVLATFGVWMVGLTDVIRPREVESRRLHQATWVPIVFFGFALGAVAWYVLGRPHQTTVRGDHDTVADVVAETSEEFRNRVRARAEEQRRRYAEQRQDKP